MDSSREDVVRLLCLSRISVFSRDEGLCWLVGSPRFLPQLTIVSALRCLHLLPGDAHSPDYGKEADDLRSLLLQGFDIVGALYIGGGNLEGNAVKAISASMKLKGILGRESSCLIIGGAMYLNSLDIHFFASKSKNVLQLKALSAISDETNAENAVWDNGCLLRCQMDYKVPVYMHADNLSDSDKMFSSATGAVVSKLRDPRTTFIIDGSGSTQKPVVLRGTELEWTAGSCDQNSTKKVSTESGGKDIPCSHLLPIKKGDQSINPRKSADIIRVRVLSTSGNVQNAAAPIAEFIPASEPARVVLVDFKLDVLCYASKDFQVSSAITELIIPAIADQISSMRNTVAPKLLSQHPQLCPYHFFPPGILHPVTAIYELRYGETEMVQVDIRRSLHTRLCLPLDRPLLRIANAFGTEETRKSGSKIKDVHVGIPRSGVSGGLALLVDGSYEYFHYLQDGFDDSGWGCAYRSLQTIVSWFRLQQYTSVSVPSHREIQQTLVDIGDKEAYFVGSREWIGAIEISFVLDKLLGVSCKVINVRSGSELPEKCRELALHFETQGTPVMIGGGVLAYTLLGVDYNDATGDCAFLILDPHYTGTDDNKKIVNGGWCGWKKAVDSKGKEFFLRDKFYNLLLPQRPNMV